MPQRPKGDAEQVGRGGLVVTRLLQRTQDGVFLHRTEYRIQLPAGIVQRSFRAVIRQLQIIGPYEVAFSQGHGPLQDVL
jgi:hypothetical protein